MADVIDFGAFRRKKGAEAAEVADSTIEELRSAFSTELKSAPAEREGIPMPLIYKAAGVAHRIKLNIGDSVSSASYGIARRDIWDYSDLELVALLAKCSDQEFMTRPSFFSAAADEFFERGFIDDETSAMILDLIECE